MTEEQVGAFLCFPVAVGREVRTGLWYLCLFPHQVSSLRTPTQVTTSMGMITTRRRDTTPATKTSMSQGPPCPGFPAPPPCGTPPPAADVAWPMSGAYPGARGQAGTAPRFQAAPGTLASSSGVSVTAAAQLHLDAGVHVAPVSPPARVF